MKIKTIVAIGIGSALFLILSRFASIPTGVPNTEIQTAYALLALMAILYGPLAGGCIGFIGHILKDLTAYGSLWFSWIIASAVFGLIVGLVSKKINIKNQLFSKQNILIFNLTQIVANLVAWGVVAPILDIIIYQEAANKVFLQGLVAGSTNILTVGVIGTALLYTYSNTRTKHQNLEKEN
ncbi:ECF-type riboflavin transporter substrate-binding protein [Candidatus Epulonipiscium viviparus]|uniref:ECF-type riboflavin transporter substrate-binding protein n=1 Tax=Candidatus Epulonipiscium viviparus TaxID=420336 RepID=UPI00273811E1|nr:ECF-type riboflavin transporter substrate-binding protein [Candidatus Epulopiscium viviparus]